MFAYTHAHCNIQGLARNRLNSKCRQKKTLKKGKGRGGLRWTAVAEPERKTGMRKEAG